MFEHEMSTHGLGCGNFLVWAAFNWAGVSAECVEESYLVGVLSWNGGVFIFGFQIDGVDAMLSAQMLFQGRLSKALLALRTVYPLAFTLAGTLALSCQTAFVGLGGPLVGYPAGIACHHGCFANVGLKANPTKKIN